MVKPGFPSGFGTSATWTNNDLGAYIKMATNVGLKESSFRVDSQHGGQCDFSQDLSIIGYDPEGHQEVNLQRRRDGQKQN
jgi:hypothetical protein